MSASPASGIFISYRRSDTKWFAALLHSRIAGAFPARDVFLDVSKIELGRDFTEALASALDRCAIQFVLIGQGWLSAQDEAGRRRLECADDWVRSEIEIALHRNIRVIPVLVDDATMPSAEQLPQSISALSRRQGLQVRFNENDALMAHILSMLAKYGEQAPLAEIGAGAPRAVIARESAGAALNFFEAEANDNKTLSVIAEQQLNAGRFGLAKELFTLVAARELEMHGVEDLEHWRARYQIARAQLLTGELSDATKLLGSVLHFVERERDDSYPLYIRAQAALARAHLEMGGAEAARRSLPGSRGIFFADQSLTAADAWIAHLEDDAPARDAFLVQLEQEIAKFPPAQEFSRSVHRMQDTMLAGNASPTMRWQPDRP